MIDHDKLDANIRKYLEDVEDAFGEDETGIPEAVEAVLDWVVEAEVLGHKPDYSEARVIIARKLELTDD